MLSILQDMICALAELESDRQPIATRYNKKSKEVTVGIMQILAKTADWLVRYCYEGVTPVRQGFLFFFSMLAE